MYLKRIAEKLFLDVAKDFSSFVVYGPRQVGKSTMILNMLNNSIKKINLDDPATLAFALNNPVEFINSNPTPLFIDEIQKAPKLFDTIKMKIDEQKFIDMKEDKKSSLMYVLSGSNQFELRNKIYDSLTGRIYSMRLHSFSYQEKMNVGEFKPFYPSIDYLTKREKLTKLKPLSKEEIFKLIIEGGMPELCVKKLNRSRFFNTYVDTYIEKDVRNSIQSKNLLLFRNFLRLIALRTGTQLNRQALSNSIGVSVKTIDDWLDILVQSHIIVLLRPYMANISKRIIRAPKIYFMDTGLCSYLCGWNDPKILEDSAMSGTFYENYVVSEIIKSLDSEGIDFEDKLFYYRDIDQKEIDLLYVDNNSITPIEIKKSVFPTKPNKNFDVLKKYNLTINTGVIIDSYPKVQMISPNAFICPIHLIGA